MKKEEPETKEEPEKDVTRSKRQILVMQIASMLFLLWAAVMVYMVVEFGRLQTIAERTQTHVPELRRQIEELEASVANVRGVEESVRYLISENAKLERLVSRITEFSSIYDSGELLAFITELKESSDADSLEGIVARLSKIETLLTTERDGTVRISAPLKVEGNITSTEFRTADGLLQMSSNSYGGFIMSRGPDKNRRFAIAVTNEGNGRVRVYGPGESFRNELQ